MHQTISRINPFRIVRESDIRSYLGWVAVLNIGAHNFAETEVAMLVSGTEMVPNVDTTPTTSMGMDSAIRYLKEGIPPGMIRAIKLRISPVFDHHRESDIDAYQRALSDITSDMNPARSQHKTVDYWLYYHRYIAHDGGGFGCGYDMSAWHGSGRSGNPHLEGDLGSGMGAWGYGGNCSGSGNIEPIRLRNDS